MRAVLAVACFILFAGFAAKAQDPVKPLSDRERAKREEMLRRELASPIDRWPPDDAWLKEDAVYIITPEEAAAFERLTSSEERKQFMEQFWLRRDPTPDTLENEYQDEHYRRIAYANDRFASTVPGWKTDRGEIYIRFGPPDEIEAGAGGLATQRWRYRYIEGIGSDVIIEFVDKANSGDYRMTMDPAEKDAVLLVPDAAPGLFEEFAKLRMSPCGDGVRLSCGSGVSVDSPTPLQRDYKDLEAAVDSNARYQFLPCLSRPATFA